MGTWAGMQPVRPRQERPAQSRTGHLHLCRYLQHRRRQEIVVCCLTVDLRRDVSAEVAAPPDRHLQAVHSKPPLHLPCQR